MSSLRFLAGVHLIGALLFAPLPVGAETSAERDRGVPGAGEERTPAAQPSGPQSILPEDTKRSLQLPGPPVSRRLIRPSDGAQPVAPQRSEGEAMGEGVEVGELRQLDPSAVGTLDEAQGGLGVAMWSGSDRGVIEAAMPLLPVGSASLAAQSLVRRLLLSSAAAPLSAASDGAPGTRLIDARIERLAALGDVPSAAALLARIPEPLSSEALSRARLDIHLLAGNIPDACDRARAAVRASDDPDFLKALAFCRTVDGDTAGAQLARDLLMEQGAVDGAFLLLLDSLNDVAGRDMPPRSGMFQSMENISPLAFAMMRLARQELPADAATGAPPAVLRAIATAPNASLSLRLASAAAAAKRGALPIADLAAIYEAVQFTDEERKTVELLAEADESVMADALLYQTALRVEEPEARLAALRLIWERGSRLNAYPLAAAVNRAAARAIDPSADLMEGAVEIVRALLVAGDNGRALEWYAMARAAASGGDLDALQIVLDMWPLVQLADFDRAQPFGPEVLDLWWKGRRVVSAEDRQRQAGFLAIALEALGYEIPENHWKRLIGQPTGETADDPSVALWRALIAASEAGRVGETALLALIVLGDDPAGKLSTAALAGVVGALYKVGLERDARAVALEAAIAEGF